MENKNQFLSGERNQSKIIKVLKQQGKAESIARDLGRSARLPGKRTSKTGKVYWETRVNRSDAAGKKI